MSKVNPDNIPMSRLVADNRSAVTGETDTGKVCEYAASHKMAGVPAVTTIDCGPVGTVKACQKCADFYARNA